MQLPRLPVVEIFPQLKKALCCSSAVLAAPPGSGKTTLVPLAILNESWLSGKKIIILEPRRLATRAAATRMAYLMGETVGQTVGYQIRFDRKISAQTRVEVVTEGVLTRRLQSDPELKGVGLVIFDEFHERSIHADVALALCLDLCILREELRLLVMSATLDAEPVAALLGDVPIITTQGKSYPVDVEYVNSPIPGRAVDKIVPAVTRVLKERQGDVLVFLPGVGEIKAIQKRLQTILATEDLLIYPLYGEMFQKDQDKVLLSDPSGRRKIILATSIAETSLTIEGVTTVVDSGWGRRPTYQPENGLTRLKTGRISKATADQRAGRAGRLGPGYCLRLWTQAEHYSLSQFEVPEILSVDLTEMVLELALWGVSEPEELNWLDIPRVGFYSQAKELLVKLGALSTAGKITERGRRLAELPLHPRLSHMLLQAGLINQVPLACDIAALLGERDILRSDGARQVELEKRLELLELYRHSGKGAVLKRGGDPAICSRIDKVSSLWQKRTKGARSRRDLTQIGNLLVFAYPDRIAMRRKNCPGHYKLATGRGATLPPGDFLAASEYLVVAKMDAGVKDGRIFMASPVDIGELSKFHNDLFTSEREVFWDDKAGRVVAQSCLKIDQLTVEQKVVKDIEATELCSALLAGIKGRGIDCLHWTRDVRQLQARIQCLARWEPQLELPDLSDGTLLENLSWLEPYLVGITRLSQLKRLDLREIFLGRLAWTIQKRLHSDVPTHFQVASGSKIPIKYSIDQPPLLAVRIQEMFGCIDKPSICRGKVVLLLHLLSPARRPIQITSDLPGFWAGSYRDVKKELKGRYPKHFWPEDPQASQPTRGVKRKKIVRS